MILSATNSTCSLLLITTPKERPIPASVGPEGILFMRLPFRFPAFFPFLGISWDRVSVTLK